MAAVAVRCRVGDGEPQYLAIAPSTTADSFTTQCARLFDDVGAGERVAGLERESDEAYFPVSDALSRASELAGQSFRLIIVAPEPDDETEAVPSRSAVAGDAPADSEDAGDTGSVLRIHFSGGPAAGGLSFTPADVMELQYSVASTGLRSTGFPAAVEAFIANQTGGAMLSRKSFYAAVRSLVPRDVVTGADTRRITSFLTAFFNAFDRSGDGVVHTAEILVGFSILCAGSKSDKLVDVFSVMGQTEGRGISRVQLWRLLRALLTALSAFSSSPAEDGEEAVVKRIEDAAAVVTRSILNFVDGETVTFFEFAEWFNMEGRSQCPWLELVDANKWPQVQPVRGAAATAPDFAAAPQAQAAIPPPAPGAAAPMDSPDPVAFSFPLGSDEQLVARRSDVRGLADMLRITGLHRFTPSELAATVLSEARGGSLTRTEFNRVAKQLVDASSLTHEQRRVAGATLATMFYSFDRYHRDAVSPASLATGLLVLAGGSKSCKLDVAWSLFEDEADTGLTRSKVWECLCALLTGLASLCKQHVRATLTDMRQTIEAGAVEAVVSLFNDMVAEGSETVSFVRFAEWYNRAGFATCAGWLEMLDHAKWPLAREDGAMPVDADARARAQSQMAADDEASDDDSEEEGLGADAADQGLPLRAAVSADDDEEEEIGEDSSGDDALIYAFAVSEAGDVLEFTRSDCDFLHAVAASTGLSSRACADLEVFDRAAVAAAGAPGGDRLPKLAFSMAMEALLRSAGTGGDALRVGRSACLSLFSWFDWHGEDSVNTNELVTGVSVFCGGSKSAKMAYAFDALDDDGQGALDHMQLWRFFRSLLVTFAFVQAGTDPLVPSDRRKVVRRVAVEVTTSVFDFVAKQTGAEVQRIAFEQFGAWYNGLGFETAPWLELLDLSKWERASPRAAAVARMRLGLDGSRTSEAATAAAPYVGRSAFGSARATEAGDDDEEDEDAPEEEEDDDQNDGDGDEDEDDDDDVDDEAGGDASAVGEAIERWQSPAIDFALCRRPAAIRGAEAGVAVRGGGLIDSAAIVLSFADCAVVARIVAVGRLDSLTAADIVSMVTSGASAGRSSLNLDEFERAIVDRVTSPEIGASITDAEWLRGCLLRLFAFCSRDSSGRVSVGVLASTLALFASGSKTDKLLAAWEALGGDVSARLSKLSLWLLLRSMLGAITAAPYLEEPTLQASHMRALREEVDVTCISIADRILTDCGHSTAWSSSAAAGQPEGVLSFEEFGQWYNTGGNEHIKWLELLDLTKWPDVGAFDARDKADQAAEAQGEQDGDDDDDDDDDDEQAADDDAQAAAGPDGVPMPQPPPGLVASVVLTEDVAEGEGSTELVERLDLRPSDVETLQEVLGVTGMGRADPWTVCRCVLACQADGTVSRDGFVLCMHALIHPSSADADTLTRVQKLLWRLWYAVDTLDSEAVPTTTLAAALCTLCAGSKSNKIAAALEVAAVVEGSSPGVNPARADEEQQGRQVSLERFREAMSGFMLVLLGMSERGANAAAKRVDRTCKTVVGRMSDSVAEFTGATEDDGVSFLEFGAWYNGGGYLTEGWIELLDLRKWSPVVAELVGDGSDVDAMPHVDGAEDEEDGEADVDEEEADQDQDQDVDQADGEADEAGDEDDDEAGEAGDHEDDEAEDREDDEAEDREDDEAGDEVTAGDSAQSKEASLHASASNDAVFGFRVMAGGEVVALSAHDVAGMSTIVRQARLDTAQPGAVLAAFRDRVNSSGELDRDGFTAAISSFVELDSMDDAARAQLISGLERLFDVFDEDASGTVDFAEFAAGFSILCSGSKSDKLVLAFRLFDLDGDNFITRQELEQYLSSFVAALISFSGAAGAGMARLSAEEAAARRAVAREMASELADTVMEQADTNKDGLISFTEFGEWYNSGGFELVPWMEMLSTSKWRGVAGIDASAGEHGGAGPAGGAAAAGSAIDEPAKPVGNDEVMLVFDLPSPDGDAAGSSSSTRVELKARDARRLRRITSASNLRALDPDTLHALFDSEADPETKTLDRDAFNRILDRMLPRSRMSAAETAVVAASMDSMFNAFDTNGDDVVGFAEFSTGFSILGSGSKSEKLSLAFSLFDMDGDGLISRVELALYLRSFLLSLIAILDPVKPITDAMRAAVNREATEVAAAVFAEADVDGSGAIDFQEFGLWYNRGGHDIVPWLELLDQSKWPLQDDREVEFLDDDDAEQGDDDDEDDDDEDYDPDATEERDEDGHHEFDDDAGDEEDADDAGDREQPEPAAPEAALERAASLSPGEHTLLVKLPVHGARLTPVAVLAGRHAAFARRLAAASTLASSQPEGLFDLVYEATSPEGAEGEIDVAAAVSGALIRRAAEPGAGVSAEEQAWLKTALPAVMAALQRSRRSSLSPIEACIALLPLCHGHKSGKFGMAARMLADLGPMLLSHARVEVLLGTIFVGLLALRGISEEAESGGESGLRDFDDDASAVRAGRRMGAGNHAEVAAGIRNVAIIACELAGSVQESMDEESGETVAASGAVSFDALGSWYNAGGHIIAQWLELLDLAKWPAEPLDRTAGRTGVVTASPGAKSTRTDDGRVVVVDEEEDVEGDAEDVAESGEGAAGRAGSSDGAPGATPYVFRVELLPASAGTSPALLLTEQDCAAVQRAASATGLEKVEVAEALAAAQAHSDSDGMLSLRAFREVVSDLVPSASGVAATELRRIASRMHEALAEEAEADAEGPRADSLELAGALSLLCAGSKSQKLAPLFEAAASAVSGDGQAKLTRLEVWAVLRSLLAGLFSFSAAARAAGFDQVRKAVEPVTLRVATSVTEEVGEDADASAGLVVDFEQFGEWYNAGGYSDVPWLELVDQRKWPNMLERQVGGPPREDDTPAADDADARYYGAEGDEFGEDEDDYAEDEDVERLDGAGEDASHTQPAGTDTRTSESAAAASGAGEDDEEEDEEDEGAGDDSADVDADDDGDDDDDGNAEDEEDADAAGEAQAPASPPLRPPAGAVIIFYLSPHAADDSERPAVGITAEDCEDLRLASFASGLAETSPAALTEAFAAEWNEEKRITGDAIRRALQAFRPAASASEDLRFSVLLTGMLRLLQTDAVEEDEEEGSYSIDDTVCGMQAAVCLSLCCEGSKTDKIRAAFATMCEATEEGEAQAALGEYELGIVLTCILFGILSASSSMAERSTSSLYSLATTEGFAVASEAFKALVTEDSEPPETITFEDFGRYYNDGGFRRAPWVELLSLAKWQGATESA